MAVSQWISAKIAKRLGPIRTMVFTHIPSQIFLIAAAFAPSVTWAIAFWLCRAALMTMDMPPRQAFTMSVVKPEERVAMAGIPWMGRSVAGTIGPTVSTAIWNALSASASFFTSALIMMSYDVSLFLLFRKSRLSMGEEKRA
jgi:MFS family permease